MKKLIRYALYMECLTFLVVLNAGVQGTVSANKLNVRVKPSTNYAVVAKLKKGDKVFVINHKKDWYEISAPQGTKVYVSSGFVKDGKIIKKVNLRSGPSVAFSAFRTSDPSESIKIIDMKSNPDWIQIEPDKPISAWVSAKYVSITPENVIELKKQLDRANAPAEAVSSAITESSIEEITGIKVGNDAVEEIPEVKEKEEVVTTEGVESNHNGILPFTDSVPKLISIEGIIVRCKDDTGYIEFALASRVNGKLFPLCYLHSSDSTEMKKYQGQRVVVSGMQRWVKDWERPVVELETIKVAEF